MQLNTNAGAPHPRQEPEATSTGLDQCFAMVAKKAVIKQGDNHKQLILYGMKQIGVLDLALPRLKTLHS